jgi:hypothetical protein
MAQLVAGDCFDQFFGLPAFEIVHQVISEIGWLLQQVPLLPVVMLCLLQRLPL